MNLNCVLTRDITAANPYKKYLNFLNPSNIPTSYQVNSKKSFQEPEKYLNTFLAFRNSKKCCTKFSREDEIGREECEEVMTDEALVSLHAGAPKLHEPAADRWQHNEVQSQFFDENWDQFTQPLPVEVTENLSKIVKSAKLAAKVDKVLDVGSGSGALIDHLYAAGVDDITAVDLSIMMLTELKMRFDDVRCWNGDIVDLPVEEFGPFDAIFFNAVFGNFFSQEKALNAALRLSKPGSRIVISHPLGSAFVERIKEKSPQIVPNSLPDETRLNELVAEKPLEVTEFQDKTGFFLAVLTVSDSLEEYLKSSGLLWESQSKDLYAFWKSPLYLVGPVVNGFGRGSRQMGVPTANLLPEDLETELEGVEKGVYYGWAQIPGMDRSVYKMVMNVGQRPTFVDGDGLSVEVHILHKFEEDFYGKQMRVVVLGFIREEMKFESLDALVERINADIQIAEEKLEDSSLQSYKLKQFFST